MGKYFETDGIRGKFNEELTIDLISKVANAAGIVFKEGSRICIGRDPRESSIAIEHILIGGLIAKGVNVDVLGVISTPIISYSILNEKYDGGIMISASHNPYYDNGIKFFGNNAMKLSDDLENEIEQNIETPSKVNITKLGIVYEKKELVEKYKKYLISISTELNSLKIGLDCANGSGYKIAPEIFNELKATTLVIGNQPNGININDQVGSTHPEQLVKLVKEKKLDFGFAFDGDADRIMLVDQDGNILDGDYMLFILAKYLKKEKKLYNDLVVSTVMANIGFKQALKNEELIFIEAQVGDRFVMQQMSINDASLGGEQSGHIILKDYLPTGDGILTAVILAKIFKEEPTLLKTIIKQVNKFPQKLVNVVVKDKNSVLDNIELQSLIKEQENQLKDTGRILVRASGTESLIRVMVEAESDVKCSEICQIIVDKVKKI